MLETILGIETSCDETSLAIVQVEKNNSAVQSVRVLSHVVHSQVEIHQPFGGVVPEVAARDHLAKIQGCAEECFRLAGLQPLHIDAVAVTMGPGLIGALMVGVLYARGFALGLKVPLRAVNHVDAHLAPALYLPNWSKSQLGQECAVPRRQGSALALTVSGGHCHLAYLPEKGPKTILGTSLDDACGEAFDKTAKLLGLPYPGGPEIEKLAQNGDATAFQFPIKLSDVSQPFMFSYSGIKTSVIHAVRKALGNPRGKISGKGLPEQFKANIAASFQAAAIEQLFDRVRNALKSYPDVQRLYIAGGVAANSHFRAQAQKLKVECQFAPLPLCSDNATMIALQGAIAWEDGFKQHPYPRYYGKNKVKQ